MNDFLASQLSLLASPEGIAGAAIIVLLVVDTLIIHWPTEKDRSPKRRSILSELFK